LTAAPDQLVVAAVASAAPCNEQFRRRAGRTGATTPPTIIDIYSTHRHARRVIRPRVKAKLAIAIGACGLLGAFWYFLSRPTGLPRIQLANGGEFRVIQMTYTPRSSIDTRAHNIGCAPAYQFKLWKLLPAVLQTNVPYPKTGISGSESSHPALSIWWAYIDPKTGKPEIGPTDDVVTILDSGEQLKPVWPFPREEGYRQIFITDPPPKSKRLRFLVSAEEQPVVFSIENPAYRK